jgi:hypothetical protein
MQTVKRLVVLGICSLFLTVPVCIPQEKVDLDVISRIRYEGFRNSRVMETASGLMDQIGARLTGSPNMKRANDWTLAKLKEFGLVNAHLEEWSPFGRGWSNEYVKRPHGFPGHCPTHRLCQGVDSGDGWSGARPGGAGKHPNA